MIYSDQDIKTALESGTLNIEPKPARAAYATSSVDLLLGNTLTVFDPPIPGVEIAVMVAQADPEETAERYGRLVRVPPGSYGPADVPDARLAPDMPILDTQVRFAGDEVAADAADDPDTPRRRFGPREVPTVTLRD